MMNMRTTAGLALVVAFVTLVGACGGASTDGAADDGSLDASTTTAMADDHDDEGAEHDDEHADDHEFAFGEPGDASDAARTIEIAATDDFTFDPPEITVAAGETITFVITNSGKIPHDFTLGDEATQAAHEEEMLEMMANGEDMSMHSDANAVLLPVGESVELTWTFTEAGAVLFGCHQPGHYAAGMVGTIDVAS